MQQLMEFSANHPILVGGFVAVLMTLVVSEVMRRMQGFQSLAPGEAVAFMNRESTRVIDVSPAADFNKGHIIGAENVPMSRIKEPDPALKKMLDAPLLVACKSGQTATAAANLLKRHGAGEVAVLKGGMLQWNSDNFPVTRAGQKSSKPGNKQGNKQGGKKRARKDGNTAGKPGKQAKENPREASAG
ncbi:MAG: rhodanese-like domain-containing protein [Xanthomonadales bacterium]|jgi:rhodanese-related sulfurtransferase|nr:rhodanese-like domain-containing protein [Xanthomonadales bacterium]